MRLNVNLATQPYRDAQRFVSVWGSVLGGLLLLLIALSFGVYRQYHAYRETSASIARERQVLQDFDNKQQQGLAILNQPQNRDVREKSDFLNGLIRRKEVSWTRIFTDLEKLMPSRVRVLAIDPRITEDRIDVTMELGGDSRDKVAELVRRMENSRVFRSAQVIDETNGAGGAQGDAYHFRVQAEYVPGQTLAAPDSKKPSEDQPEGGK
jgi:Tfp pilus assembly protein PilN